MPRQSQPLENELKNAVLQYLKVLGIKCWRQNSGRAGYVRFHTAPGMSDICGILAPHGRFLAIETKRKGEKPTADQLRFIADVNAAGGLAFVAYSLDDVCDRIQSREVL